MNNIKLTDIKTELFTRTIITDYGVRFESFDRQKWIESKLGEQHKFYFIIVIHILFSGGINLNMQRNNHLSNQQLDEIQRVSQLLRNI